MITPPTGEVTLVFTDIEGSTKLWQQWAGLFESVLATHHNVMRHCIGAEGGYEVKTEGDAFMVAFDQPERAVSFCLRAQMALYETAWPVELEDDEAGRFKGLRVRMGVHIGSPSCVIDPVSQRMDYYGLMVNRAARIAHAAMGGQILISQEIFDLIDWSTYAVDLRDLGPRPLRDLNDETHLHQLLPAELAARQFGEAKASRVWRTNLVAAVDSFVGRTSELEQVATLLSEGHRLLTVVGAGGTGKTRLVCQYGVERVSAYEGGVWFADLSMAQTESELCQCVADAFGIPLTARDPIEQIGNAIRGRGSTLILLDNFEQVVQFAQSTLGIWIGLAPEASFVVTSRERLRLPGEQLLYLDPLGLSEAVALFETRARSVRPDFSLTDSNLKTVEEIVSRLDCMSLAIELAAARSAILKPSQLLERLSQRFRLLRGRSREGSHRQSTLRNAIDWSWKLLAPYERAALAQLSVFSGRMSLDAAESVIDLDAFPDAPWAMDVVESLHDKSLLRLYRGEQDGTDTFGMYQSVALYASEKLAEDPVQRTQAQQRHLAFYSSLCSAVVNEEDGRHLGLKRLVAVYANLVSAFEHAMMLEDGAAIGCSLLGMLRVLAYKGPYSQAAEYAWRGLQRGELLSDGHRALVYTGWLKAVRQSSGISDQIPKLTEALEWAKRSGDLWAEMDCRRMRILLAFDEGKTEQVPEMVAEALEICHRRGKPEYGFHFYHALADYHMDRGEQSKAQEPIERAAALVTTYQLLSQMGPAAHKRGRMYEDQGRLTEARHAYEQGVSAYLQFGNFRGQSVLLGCLANIHRIQGRYDEARTHYEAAMRIHKEWGNPLSAAIVQGNMGNMLKELGELEEAHRLYRLSGETFKRMGRLQNEAISLGNRGELLIRLGRIDEAKGVLSQAVALCAKLHFKAEGAFLTYLARVQRVQGDLNAAGKSLQRGERLLRSSMQRYHLGVLLCERGEWAIASGDMARAKQAWADAMQISTDLEANPRSELGAAVRRLEDRLSAARNS